MDFENLIVGVMGYFLGQSNGVKKADHYIQQHQEKENQLLREELMRMQVRMNLLQRDRRDQDE